MPLHTFITCKQNGFGLNRQLTLKRQKNKNKKTVEVTQNMYPLLQEMIYWSSCLANRNNPFPNRSWERPILHNCQLCQGPAFIWTLEYCVNTLAVSRTGCVKPSTQQCNVWSTLHPIIMKVHSLHGTTFSWNIKNLCNTGSKWEYIIRAQWVFSTVILGDLHSRVELITLWFFLKTDTLQIFKLLV